VSFPPQPPHLDGDAPLPRQSAQDDLPAPLTRREARRRREELSANPEPPPTRENSSDGPTEEFSWLTEQTSDIEEKTEYHADAQQRYRGPLRSAETPPPKNKKPLWIGLVALTFFVILVVIAGFTLSGPISKIFAVTEPNDYEGDGSGSVVFEVRRGASGETIAKDLADKGVIKTRGAFYSLVLKQKPQPIFQPGSYPLANQMSARAALAALLNPSNMHKITVPEGAVLSDILQSVAELIGRTRAELEETAADFRSFGLPAEASSLEGFLFPATYTLMPGTPPHDALQTMVDRMMEALNKAGVPPADRFKTVNLAALIQKEARLGPDFVKISRVFQNRLSAGWKLESDATVSYSTRQKRASTTDAERHDPANPYNTYVHPGLPVGPISNPGDVAIDAALHPASGPWLFFVTVNLESGETVYSTTNEEHEAAVARWQAWMAVNPSFQ